MHLVSLERYSDGSYGVPPTRCSSLRSWLCVRLWRPLLGALGTLMARRSRFSVRYRAAWRAGIPPLIVFSYACVIDLHRKRYGQPGPFFDISRLEEASINDLQHGFVSTCLKKKKLLDEKFAVSLASGVTQVAIAPFFFSREPYLPRLGTSFKGTR